MQRKHVLYLFAIVALLVAMVPLGAAAQPGTPDRSNEAVGNEQLPTAQDLQLTLNGPTAPAAPPVNPAAILFDNGPLTTNPGAGAGGANASAVQTALGLSTYGFGHAISSGFRVADDFTVPAGGWTVNTITFYAYQTGSTTTTTIDNVNLQIWNGVPGAAGSSVVFGDTTTNRLAGSSFSNIYRVLDTALTNNQRPVMADVVTVNTNLPAGTYWLDWQTGGTLSSGPWAPPVSILGQTAKPGSNGLQYDPTTGAWNALVDTGANAQQDLPFVIEGQGGTSTPPNINVSPLSLSSTQPVNTSTNQTLTIGNTGSTNLTWTIAEASAALVQNPDGGAAPSAPAAGATGSRGGTTGGPAPIVYTSPADFSQGFDDISVLAGQGWFFQNNSSPLGTSGWFQGNDGVFPAQAGAPTAYIGANFNNAGDVGTISNWMLTPEIALANGDTIAFWTRSVAASIFPDRLQVRLSTAGPSTNVGTLPTDVGAFTTLLLDINPTLAQGGYPEDWTQFTATLSGIPAGATGRIAWRYFVTDAGPLGANSDYIGIDTVEFTSAGPTGPCDAPSDVPWLSEVPTSGTTTGGGSTPVQVTFNATGLALGTYTANLCVNSNDPDPGPGNGTAQVIVPVQLVVVSVPVPAIELNKTVGTTAGVCATTDSITVTAGTQVYYCYQAHNTGQVTLNYHDLTDSVLGVLANDLPYVLAPGAYSPEVIVPATPMATVTNVGTWTAYSSLAGYAADDTIPYNFQDISGTGTAISLGDDEVSAAIPMGFTFDYFGTNYSDMYVSSNGFMTVLPGQSNGCCSGQPIPTAGSPDGVIAGWWDDLYPPGGGSIVYQTLGSAPNRVFIVQFTDVQHFSSGNPVTLQYKIFEGTNVIEVHYQAAPSDGSPHSAGIENATGTAGVQWYYGPNPLTTPEAVRYTQVPVDSATDTDTATVTVLTPNIDVDPLSLSTTLVFNTSATLPMTVTNTGQGNLMWEIAEANQANGMYLPMVGPRTAPQARVYPFSKIDGVSMSAAANGTGQTVIPDRPATPDLLTITHSTSQAIVSGNSVACNAGGLHTDNSYLREFDLPAFGITGPFAVSQVEIGVETALGATGSQPITVNLYTKINPGAPLTFGNLSPIGTASVQVSDQDLTLFTVPVAGVATAGSVLVVEVFTPNGQTAGNSFFIGSNPDPETAPSYLAAADCGVPEPATTASIGFPDMHIVMNVTGSGDVTGCVAPSDVSWMSVAPTSGTTTGGTSTPVQVTLDSTGLQVGSYSATLCVTSNDPDAGPGNGTELVQVPVTLDVINQCPSGSVTGALTSSDPTFNRPVSGNPGCFPDPYVGTAVRYDVYSYNLTGPAPADVWASLCGSTAFDSILVVYQAPNGAMHPFNPTQPCTNAVAYNDDYCRSQPLIDQNTFGNGWIDIVVAGYANDGMGPYTLDLDSVSCNGGSANINVSPLSVNNGQTCMNTNTQVTQQMNVQNTGDRTLYTWAADSSRASCVPINDVPWLRMPEASFATAAGAASSVAVTFDSTNRPPGVYTANVCLGSNDPDAASGNGTGMVIVPATMTVCSVPTAVDLTSMAATPVQSPLPAGIPMAAFPAAAGLALAAAYAVRRKK